MGAHAGRAAHPALPAGRAADRGLGRRQVQRFRDAAAGTDQARLRRPGRAVAPGRRRAHRLAARFGERSQGARRGQLGVQLRARAGGGRHRCRGDDPAGTVRLGGAVWPGQRHDHRGRRADPGGVRAQSERHADTGGWRRGGRHNCWRRAAGRRGGGCGRGVAARATAPGFDAGHGSPQAQALLFQAQAVLAQAQAVLAQVQSRGSPAGRGEQAVRRTEHAQHRPAGRLGADRIWNFPAVWQGR